MKVSAAMTGGISQRNGNGTARRVRDGGIPGGWLADGAVPGGWLADGAVPGGWIPGALDPAGLPA
jgi:hypothetical protein